MPCVGRHGDDPIGNADFICSGQLYDKVCRNVEMKKEEERKKEEGKELAEEGGANNPAEMEYDVEENESIEAEVSENSGDSTLDE